MSAGNGSMKEAAYDVVIPVYRPDRRLLKLLYALSEQTLKPARTVLMHTVSADENRALWNEALGRYPDLIVSELTQREFDHAATRNEGIRLTGEDTPYVLLMTQDAVPAQRVLAERLLDMFAKGDKIAAVYARQVAGKGASFEERSLRAYNYPEHSAIRTAKDIESLGVKAFFCSNVCAMYDRRVFETLGAFDEPAVFNEDMVYAAKAMRAGFGIGYAADAVVYHTHNDSLPAYYRRSVALGYSQAAHPEVFKAVSSEKAGAGLVKKTAADLIRQGKAYRLPYFVLQCGCRYLGYLTGKLDYKLKRRRL